MHEERIAMNDRNSNAMHYGQTPGQLGSMKAQGFEAALSSPPYAGQEIDYGDRPNRAAKLIDNPNFKGRTHWQNNDKTLTHYGESDGQLSSMKAKGFQSAVSSPPFEKSLDKGQMSADERRQAARDSGISNSEHISPIDMDNLGQLKHSTYGATAGNIGNDAGEDFWIASRQIVDQVYQLLLPGGHACWVVKDFVKAKERVPFCDQWRQLCEAAGFVTLHEHHAMMVRNTRTQIDLEGKHITK